MAGHEEHLSDTGPDARLANLLEAISDRELTEAEAGELRDLIAQSEEHRRSYLKTVYLLVGMRKWAGSRGDGDIDGLVTLMAETDPGAGVSEGRRLERRSRRSMLGAAVALAATILIAVALPWGSESTPTSTPVASSDEAAEPKPSPAPSLFVEDTQQIVARVVAASADLRWSSDSGPPDFLMRLRPGDLVAIEAGVAQVEFTSGVELTLDSACTLQVTSPTSARLIRGMLVGQANGEGAFTVVTPSATVVDLGSEFGVSVSEYGTDVTVFDGEVHVHGLHPTESADGFVRKLVQGASVRVDEDGVHRNAPATAVAKLQRGRRSTRLSGPAPDATSVSLLDLLAGKRYYGPIVAGSIDPVTGFWGRYLGFSEESDGAVAAPAERETSYRATRWTPLIDGVFVPRPRGLATQYSSRGQTIDLPANAGKSRGPIWARRRLELEAPNDVFLELGTDSWERSVFESATDRLARASDGLLGLHANVGITFDLDAIRQRASSEARAMRLVGAIANLDDSQLISLPRAPSRVDARFYVDGQLRYSRIDFEQNDGEELFDVLLSADDRFLTIVTTDADGSFDYDHVVLIDPRFEPYDFSYKRLISR